MPQIYQPQLGTDINQGFNNLGSLFAPPSATDLVAKQNIAKSQADAAQRAQAIANLRQKDPTLGDLFAANDPDAVIHALRYQQYVKSQAPDANVAQLDRGNLAIDGDINKTGYGAFMKTLGVNDSRYLPPAMAQAYGVPAIQHGVISLGDGNAALPGSGTTPIMSAPDDGKPGSTDEAAVGIVQDWQKTHPQGGNPNDDPVFAAALHRLGGSGGVTVNTGDNTSVDAAANKAYGGVLGKDVIGADVQRGAGAGRTLQDVATMRAAINSGGDNITYGPFSKYALQAKQLGGSIFGQPIAGTAEADVINNVGYGLATAAAKGISSRPTQVEFARALETKPGLAMSKQGSLALLDVMEQHARDDQNIAQMANDPKARANWIGSKQAYYDAHPIMSPFNPQKPFGADDINQLTQAAQAAGTLAPTQQSSVAAGPGGTAQSAPPTQSAPMPAQGALPTQGAPQAAVQMPTLTDPSQVSRLPSGARFKTPDGRIKVAP